MTTSAAPSADLSTTIQPLGGMIACDAAGDRITHVSEDIANILDRPPSALLAADLRTVLPRELRHNFRNIRALRRYKDDRHYVGRHTLPRGVCDVSVSWSAATDHAVFEFEPASGALQTADDFAVELRGLSHELRLADSDTKLLDGLAGFLRMATGYDSAVIYRFGPQGGDVVAETRNTARRRLMGQRLAAIEALGDALTGGRRPILHFVADVAAAQAPICAAPDQPEGLDLYFCHLRGTTGAHKAALAELEAAAAMTAPLIMNSGLWGMVLLLNRAPRTPSRYIRLLSDALAALACDRMEILRPSLPAAPTAADACVTPRQKVC